MTTTPSPSDSTARRGRRTPWLVAAAAVSFCIAVALGWGQLSLAAADGAADPALAARPSEPQREVILLIDSSAEVGPASLSMLRSAATAALDELGEQDLFNVIAFGSRPRALYPGSWPAVQPSRDKARRFVTALSPGGGRSVVAAAEAALAPVQDGYGPARIVRASERLPRRVVLLTSRPVEDAAALAAVERRLPPAVRLDLIPATPSAVESVRALLRSPAPLTTSAPPPVLPAEGVAGLTAAAPVTSISEPGAPPAISRRALLVAVFALPVFLLALGWTVRRGLAAGPVSG